MDLPLQPPIRPMLAKLTREFPEAADLLFEPKWDGFRCLVFWDGTDMFMQSRDTKPLGRYFPELEAALKEALPPRCVVDGEIVIAGPNGLEFENLLQRIHPAASRIQKLAAETPSSFVAFDLLCAEGQDLTELPFSERRERLEKLLSSRKAPLYLTPATTDAALAKDWFERFEGAGLDGVIAKKSGQTYCPDKRVMLKVKHQRTADVIVGGYRWAKDKAGEAVGSLLLGLYDEQGQLHHVGFTSSFKAAQRKELVGFLEPYKEGEGAFGDGRTPGAPSRWSAGKDLSWVSLRPELVCEVAFENLQSGRFRHAATFLRWRPDKPPQECDYAQLETAVPYELGEIFATTTRGPSTR